MKNARNNPNKVTLQSPNQIRPSKVVITILTILHETTLDTDFLELIIISEIIRTFKYYGDSGDHP